MKEVNVLDSLFLPITKIDVKKRLVYGTMTEEVPDKSGEIFDYATGKAEVQKWSDDTKKNSKGKSLGNLRAMHSNIAAGKLTDIEYHDADKRIDVITHVVDDNEWKKVEAGVYTGFSIGGGYAKRWTDPTNPALKRYTPRLSELSLVDNPCVPTALFEVVKEDGSHEMRKFNSTITKEENDMTKKAKIDKVVISSDALIKMIEANKVPEDIMSLAKANIDTSTLSVGEQNVFNVLYDQSAAVKKQADEDKVVDPAEPAKTEEPKPEDNKEADAAKAVDADDLKKDARNSGTQVWKSSITGEIFDTKAEMTTHNINALAKKKIDPVTEELNKINSMLDKKEGKVVDEVNKADMSSSATTKVADDKKEDEKDKKKKEIDKSADDKKKDDKKEEAKKSVEDEDLKKGLYLVSRFACAIESLNDIKCSAEYERKYEGDDSTVPEMITESLKSLGVALNSMVQEEVAELFASDEPIVTIMAMAAKEPEGTKAIGKFISGDVDILVKATKDKEGPMAKFIVMLNSKEVSQELEKAGATISKANKDKILGVHKSAMDHATTVGEVCKAIGIMDSDDKEKTSDDAEKLFKSQLDAERKTNEALTKTIEAIPAQLQEIFKRVEQIAAQPAPGKGVLRAVTKSADNGGDGDVQPSADKVNAELEKLSPDQRALLLMKATLSQPKTTLNQ